MVVSEAPPPAFSFFPLLSINSTHYALDTFSVTIFENQPLNRLICEWWLIRLKGVATISANGGHKIGELLARAMEKVGKEGVITVADGNTLDNELEVVEGMKITRGYVSRYFVTDAKTQKCELEDPLILIHEKKISDMNSLVRILKLAVKRSRPLLIVAKDVESEPLTMLIINKHCAGLKFTKDEYSQVEIDEVRSEWAECVQEHIYG